MAVMTGAYIRFLVTAAALLFASASVVTAFTNHLAQTCQKTLAKGAFRPAPTTFLAAAPKSHTFEVTVNLPPSGSERQATMGIDSILSVPTELVVVRYQVPFGLNVEPRKGLAVVTQGGPGGEQPGDVLRYTSQWTLGLPPGEGLGTTAAAFAGGIKWQCSMYNVVKAKSWELVVEALTSNTSSRTDEVVLIFERPLNGVTPPELM
jgi:hypothetical protein